MESTARPERDGPFPPPGLHDHELPLVTLDGPLVRIHRADRGAVYFGKAGRYRWDDPSRQYGVMYASLDPEGAFVETLLADAPMRMSTAYGGSIPVSGSDLDLYGLSDVQCIRPLRAVDLRADGLVRIGATGVIVTGAHTLSQAWSRALFTHPQAPDAIVGPAKMDLARVTIAIHERAKPSLTAESRGPLSGLRDVMDRIASTYPIVIIR